MRWHHSRLTVPWPCPPHSFCQLFTAWYGPPPGPRLNIHTLASTYTWQVSHIWVRTDWSTWASPASGSPGCISISHLPFYHSSVRSFVLILPRYHKSNPVPYTCIFTTLLVPSSTAPYLYEQQPWVLHERCWKRAMALTSPRKATRWPSSIPETSSTRMPATTTGGHSKWIQTSPFSRLSDTWVF